MNLQAGLVGVHQLCYSNCFSALSCFSSCCTWARCGCPKPVTVLRSPWHTPEPGLCHLAGDALTCKLQAEQPLDFKSDVLMPSPSLLCLQVMGKGGWQLSLPSPLMVSSTGGTREEEEQLQEAAHSPSVQWAQPSWCERRWPGADSSGLSGILRHTAEVGTGSNLSPHSSCSGEQWLSPAWIIIVYFTKSQNMLVPTGWIVVVTTAVIRQSYKLELLPAI